jgi:hypothetical protein
MRRSISLYAIKGFEKLHAYRRSRVKPGMTAERVSKCSQVVKQTNEFKKSQPIS